MNRLNLNRSESFFLMILECFASLLLFGIFLFPLQASGMLSERPGNSKDSTLGPMDLSGKSIKEKRVRVIHSADSALPGTSLYFQEKDPWLGYQRGKDFILRQFRKRDGLFGQQGAFFGKLVTDKVTPLIDRDHTSSCGVCHNIPYRDAGAGITIPKNGGEGRNTTHFYGGGLVEMIGLQTRLKVLEICDPDKKGFVPKDKVPSREVLISPGAGEPLINYGKCGDNDGDGRPDLNKAFRLWYVDQNGKRVFEDQNGDGVVNLLDSNVAGYNFEMHVYGWGEATGGMAPTLRSFFAEPSDTHAGMQAYDPTMNTDDGTGLARISNAGARQFALHATPDRGHQVNPQGISLDDPDGDGFLNEISEGDLDIAEWYMLNAPRPGNGEETKKTRRGALLFKQWKCEGCHTPDWKLEAGDPANPHPYRRYDGDRRFFDLNVFYNSGKRRLEGKVIPLFHKEGDRTLPNRKEFMIKGVYSDFKHHDLGPDFHQVQFDGSELKQFRTAPLWGVATTFPYGHDGKSLTLDEVIRRHGGEAEQSARRYRSAGSADREALIAFLNSLILYQSDSLPTDLNGDGVIESHFKVAGKDTGEERFNPEFLFNHPCEIEGPTTRPNGEPMISYACLNVVEAYQEDLPFIRDQDNDGFPDAADPCPLVTGYLDGCHSTLPLSPAETRVESGPEKELGPAGKNLGGPEGGFVNLIFFDPQNPSVLYAGLDGGGVFKSADGGATWQTRNQGLGARDVMAMAIHPSHPEIVYAGTGKGVFKSVNGGESWTAVNQGIENPIIMAMAMHPLSPNILVVGTKSSLFKTTDGGGHWSKIEKGLPHHAHSHGIIIDAGMATTPTLNQRSQEIILVATESEGVYKSLDGGESWTPSNEGLKNLHIQSLAQNPQVPSMVYASNESGGIYFSSDYGDHWKLMENSLSGFSINAVLVHPSRPAILFAAVEGKGLYRSMDSGKNWTFLSLSASNPVPHCIAVHPWSPSTLFVGTYLEGVFQTTDGGEHWVQANSGMTHVMLNAFLVDPSDSSTFFEGTEQGLFISRDGGSTWKGVDLQGKRGQALTLVFDPKTSKIYTGTTEGHFSTSDHGQTWKEDRLGPPSASSLYYISRNSGIDYIAGFGGLFKKSPADKDWVKIAAEEFNYPQVLYPSVDRDNPQHIFVGAEQGLFESRDGGLHWKSFKDEIGKIRVRGVNVSPVKPGTILVATDQGLRKSTDGGANWVQPAGGIPERNVSNLVANPANPDHLYVRSLDGLFVTFDGGDQWKKVEYGANLIPLSFNPTGKNLLGTDHNGILDIPLRPAS